MKLLCLLAPMLLLACGTAGGESIEDLRASFDGVFATNRIAPVSFSSEAGWQSMLDSFLAEGDETYKPAAFTFDAEALPRVGLRIKGKVRDGEGSPEKKYALKINTNYFEGERFRGIDKIHFENNNPDPSAMRQMIASRLFRAFGLPSPRMSYARVTMEGQDFGIYTMIQDVDKRFLKDSFGTDESADDGNLYRCVETYCSLEFHGKTKESYFTKACADQNGCGLVLETNLDDPALNDYTDLIDFVDFLANSTDAEFAAGVEAWLDVPMFLKFLATSFASGAYEGYLAAYNNFFIYKSPVDGRFIFIPWGMDKSYGESTCTDGTIPADPFAPWCPGQKRTLAERLLAVDSFKAQYVALLRELLENHFTEAGHKAWVDELDALAGESIASDPKYMHDPAAFEPSARDGSEELGITGILQFVRERRTAILAALEAEDE